MEVLILVRKGKIKDVVVQAMDGLRSLSDSEKLNVINKIPASMLGKLYASRASRDQVVTLFEEWDRFIEDDDLGSSFAYPDEVAFKCREKIRALAKALRRARKGNWVPDWVREKYL